MLNLRASSNSIRPQLKVEIPKQSLLSQSLDNLRPTNKNQISLIYITSKQLFETLKQDNNLQNTSSLTLGLVSEIELKERFKSLNESSETVCQQIPHLKKINSQRFNDIFCPEPTAAFHSCKAIAVFPEATQLHANLISVPINNELTRTYFATQHPYPNDQLYWLLCIHNGSMLIDLTTQSDHLYLSSRDSLRGYLNLQYFPEDESPIRIGKYEVRLQKKTHIDDNPHYNLYSYDIFNHETEEIEKSINRLHFTNWIDTNGIDLVTLETLVKIVRNNLQSTASSSSPITNCKAGVGRSGTLILACLLLELILEGQITIENYVDRLDKLIQDVRIQRGVSVVQTFEQYFTLVKFCIVMLAKHSGPSVPAEIFQSTVAS